VFRNWPEDHGIDYLVDDPAWRQPLVLAQIGGHFSGPGRKNSAILVVPNHLVRRKSVQFGPDDGKLSERRHHAICPELARVQVLHQRRKA